MDDPKPLLYSKAAETQHPMSPSQSQDSLSPNADIKKRRRLMPQETEYLVQVFEHCPRPNAVQRDSIAQRLGMSSRGVQIWFQNRRAKVKRDLMETGQTMLLFTPTLAPFDLFHNMINSTTTAMHSPTITMESEEKSSEGSLDFDPAMPPSEYINDYLFAFN